MWIIHILQLGVSKQTEKPRKLEKKITEKTEPWKKTIKQIKFLKKSASSVWFQFYKPKTEKNRAKPKK